MMRLLLLMLTITVFIVSLCSPSVSIYLVPHGESRLEALWGKPWPLEWWLWSNIQVPQSQQP